MAKSRARFLAELLGSDGLVKTTTSSLAGADGIIDLGVLPSIPNSKLTNSSITINSSATSLGGSITLTTANVSENTNLYYTDARVGTYISGDRTYGNITTTGYLRGPSTFTIDPATHGDDTGTLVIAGNVGIGTESPNGKLQFDNSTNTRKIVLYEGANNDYQFYGFGVESQTLIYSTYLSTDDHVFVSGASSSSRNELMRIGGDGNVGIGTNDPKQKLHVTGSSNDTIDETTGTLKLQGSGGNGLLFGTIASSPYSSYIQSAFVNDTSVIRYALSLNPIGGNVGIGTTSPGRLLDLRTNTTSVDPLLLIRQVGAGDAAMSFQTTTDPYGFTIGVDGSDADKFKIGTGATSVSAATKFTIDNTGKVGIGTSSPTNAHLVISSTDSNKISIDGGSSQNGMRWESVGSANTFYLFNGTFGTAGFGLYNVNTAEAPLWVQNAGNVGIGTTAPTQKLEVAGTALVENAKLKAIAESNTQTAIDVFVYDTRKDSDGGAWRKRTQHTSWYSEASDTRRGTRKDFPCVAVIVAHAAGVTIYDGDDPDMPMWMYIYAGYSHNYSIGFSQNGAPTAVTARDGVIYTTTNGGTQDNSVNGLFAHNFISDRMYQWNISGGFGYYPLPIEGRDSGGSLAYHESKVSYDATKKLVSPYLNDVAVTVLPNAPIDADTGLPVPTIAVATQSGISIIKDTGTVVDITVASGGYTHITDVDLSSDGWVAWSHSDSRSAKAAPIPSADTTYGFWSYNAGAYNFYESHAFASNLGNVPALVSVDGGITDHILGKVVVSTDGLTLLGLQKNYDVGVFGDADMPLSAYITSDYNTGWMMSDIKLATLSDTEAADNTEYVGGYGDFTDGSAWTKDTGWSTGSNVATKTASTGANYITRASSATFVSGEWYQAEFDVLSGNGPHVQLVNRHTNGVTKPYTNTTNVDVAFFAVGSKCYAIWQQNTNNTNIVSLYASVAVSLDNFKIYKLSAHDRSYNNNDLIRRGTLTKTAVETGAELLSYSGFNSSNSLQTAHDSAFAVGTQFSASMWLKGGSAGETPFSVESNGSSINDTDSTILVHTHANGFYFYTRGANDSTWNTTGAASISSTNVGLTPWHMVTISQDSSGRKLYVDGKLNVSDSVVKTIDGVEGTLVVTCGARPGFTQNYTGNMALVRFSGTPVTPEQVAKMYNDEKHLFATNAKATLYGTSNNTSAIAYDEDTELLHAGTSAGRSVFQGLNRVDNTTDAVGTAISASNGFIVEE